MEKVTNTNQLTRGQNVIVINKTNGFRVDVYRYISEDVSTASPDIKEHYGYFTDIADRPVRMYLHEKRGMPVYKNYARKEILMCAKQYHEKELADIEAKLSGKTQNWQYDEE